MPSTVTSDEPYYKLLGWPVLVNIPEIGETPT